MLTKDEEDFISYWENNRDKEKSLAFQLRAGLMPGLFFVIAVILVVFSGWYTRANMIINNTSSLITIFIALGIIVIGYAIFSKSQQWEMKEQHYKSLKAKQQKQNF